MKIADLAAFGHNIADSLASGICLMVGVYDVDIYGEASAAPDGQITVDFMTGAVSGSPVSARLLDTIERYAARLPEFAALSGISVSGIAVFTARFGTDSIAGPHFKVTVEARDGRRSVAQYVGIPGKRFRHVGRDIA